MKNSLRHKCVALIQTPQIVSGQVPLGLLTLASFIKHYGYDPIIIDLDVHYKHNKEVGYSPDFFEEAAQKILSFSPHVLGFSVVCNSLPASLLIASECKKQAPHIPIIFGGPEVNFDEIDILETFKQVDVIVRGEGEFSLLEVLRTLDSNSPFSGLLGITYRKSKKIIRNPDRPFIEDLDELPYLDLSLLPQLSEYKIGGIEAGRGCPYCCTFCSTSQMWKRTYRMKSAQRLVSELEDMHRAFGTGEDPVIRLIHDNFLTSRKFSDEFTALLSQRNILWKCSSRLDCLDGHIIETLKQSGCRDIFLGIETGSQEMQCKIKKNLPLDKLFRIVKMFVNNDIQPILSFIVDFPNETEKQINETLQMALMFSAKYGRSKIIIFIFAFTYLKGSESYLKVKNSFEKLEYFGSNLSPLITKLEAERNIIKSYPKLFPSFFRIKDAGIIPTRKGKFIQLFRFLVNFFPNTALFLIDNLRTTPFQMAQEMLEFFNNSVNYEGRVGPFLNQRDLTSFISYVLINNSFRLPDVTIDELCYYYFKQSNCVSVQDNGDEYLITQKLLGNKIVMAKEQFNEALENLNNKSSSQIEDVKRELKRCMVVVPAIIDESILSSCVCNRGPLL